MNVLELIFTAVLVTVAVTVVVRYFWRGLHAQEPDCGGCNSCPGHAQQGCCAVKQEGGH